MMQTAATKDSIKICSEHIQAHVNNLWHKWAIEALYLLPLAHPTAFIYLDM